MAWIGCLSLVGFVGLRLTHHDNRASIALVESVTLYLLFPAWVAFGFALGSRRRFLAVVSGFLVITHLVFLYPEMHAGVSISSAARSAPSIRVFSANLLANNRDLTEMIEQVRASDANLVFLQEYDRPNRHAFEQSGVLDEYPYQIEFRQPSPYGSIILSKVPFIDSSLAKIGGVVMPTAVLSTPIGPVTVVCVHLNRPYDETQHAGWTKELAALADFVRARTTPLIVAGDFNSTTSHRPFRDVLAAGVVDAFRSRGEGLSNSWPADQSFPPLIRIDHLLTTKDIVATDIHNGKAAGSDHLPMIANLALVGSST